jgi:hypothetical protein
VMLRQEEGIWFAETGPAGHLAVWGRKESFQRCLMGVRSF